MTTAAELADAIGRKRMQDALGVGATAVSNRVVEGQFPPSWFLVVRALAAEVGKPCPPELFGMKIPSVKPSDLGRSAAAVGE